MQFGVCIPSGWQGPETRAAAADGQDSLIKNEVGVKTYVSATQHGATLRRDCKICYGYVFRYVLLGWALACRRRRFGPFGQDGGASDPSLGPVIIELIKITLLSTAIAPGCVHVCAIPCGHFVSKCFIYG